MHDLELKTDPRYREFKTKRDDLETTEALALVRARSRERETLIDNTSDLDVYDGRRRRSDYRGESGRKRGSIDDARREIIVARNDPDRYEKRKACMNQSSIPMEELSPSLPKKMILDRAWPPLDDVASVSVQNVSPSALVCKTVVSSELAQCPHEVEPPDYHVSTTT